MKKSFWLIAVVAICVLMSGCSISSSASDGTNDQLTAEEEFKQKYPALTSKIDEFLANYTPDMTYNTGNITIAEGISGSGFYRSNDKVLQLDFSIGGNSAVCANIGNGVKEIYEANPLVDHVWWGDGSMFGILIYMK